MITLVSTIIGLVSGLLPSIIKIFEKRQDQKYEIELTRIKLAAAEKNLTITKDIEDIKGSTSDSISVRNHDIALGDDHSFVGAIRASVRPIITYVFFFFFLATKTYVAWIMVQKNIDPERIMQAIWDDYTLGIFSAIIAFWFSARAMEKVEKIVAKSPTPPTKK